MTSTEDTARTAKTCGHYGGVTASGKPCRRKVIDGRCSLHSEVASATLQRLKKRALERLESGTASLADASSEIGVDPATVWRWRQSDAEFDQGVREAISLSDRVRTTIIEDGLFEKLAAGRGGAAEYYLWLTNRDPERWKHQNRLEVSGPEGGAIEIAGLNLANLTVEDIAVLKGLAKKTREAAASPTT